MLITALQKQCWSNSRTKMIFWKPESQIKVKKKTQTVTYFTLWFWKKIGTVYTLLPESFNLLSVSGFWSLYNFMLKQKSHQWDLFAVTCAFGEYAFSLTCSWNEYANEFSKPKALHQFTFNANHSLSRSVNIFYFFILLLCITNLIFTCGVWIDETYVLVYNYVN